MSFNKFAKKLCIMLCCITICTFSSGCGLAETEKAVRIVQKILLSWDNGSAEISLYDNLTAKDLISRLPLEVNVEDYNSTERIIRFDNKLTEDSAAKGAEPASGDVTVYAPWGNIAIFYKPFSYSDDLIKLGKVESGLDALAEISDGTKVTITKL